MYQDIDRLSFEELALFNELFSNRFGLHFPDHKREILENRLLPRLRANRVKRFSDYYLLLQYDFNSEREELVRSITNNESYFFRETLQFEALRGEVLEELRQNSAVPRQLRILSAGCSSGEEPYTLNIFARRGHFGREESWLRIDAIDIDTEHLDKASNAIYGSGSLRALDQDQTHRYFERQDEYLYRLRSIYRRGVNFRQGNILDLETYRPPVPYDAIFCRNVLIYFAEPALKAVISNFARALRPGGFLFLGHSESIIGLTESFQAERLGSCIAYRRVES